MERASVTDTDYPVLGMVRGVNVGLRLDPSELETMDVLVVDKPTIYEGFDVERVVYLPGGFGARLRNGRVRGEHSSYSVDMTNGWRTYPDAAKSMHVQDVTINNSDPYGKTILGGGYSLDRCEVLGGGDSIHQNFGGVIIANSFVGEQNMYPGDHVDAIQHTSGGAGGSMIVMDSVLQGPDRQQNSAIQSNVVKDYVLSCRNLLSGGAYTLHESDASCVSTDDLFAFGTSQFGLNAGGWKIRNGRWVSRQRHPRVSGYGGNHTPSGEAAGFPGEFVPVS